MLLGITCESYAERWHFLDLIKRILCRAIVRHLLKHNADALACNKQGKWSLDMSASKSDVWHMLYEEVQWRSYLEQSRPCHLVLVRYFA